MRSADGRAELNLLLSTTFCQIQLPGYREAVVYFQKMKALMSRSVPEHGVLTRTSHYSIFLRDCRVCSRMSLSSQRGAAPSRAHGSGAQEPSGAVPQRGVSPHIAPRGTAWGEGTPLLAQKQRNAKQMTSSLGTFGCFNKENKRGTWAEDAFSLAERPRALLHSARICRRLEPLCLSVIPSLHARAVRAVPLFGCPLRGLAARCR